MKSIGSKIKQLAEMNNLTVADIARKLGKSKQALYEMIGKDDVNTKVLRELCEWYNVPITFFFADEPDDSYTTMKKRLREFIKSKGISLRAFEKTCGLGNGYVAAMRNGMSVKKLGKVLATFPELNRNWLLFGEGEMTRNTGAPITITQKEPGNEEKAKVEEIHFGSRIKELLHGDEEEVYKAAIRLGMRENKARGLINMQDVNTSVLRKFSMYYGVPLSYFFDDGDKSNETNSNSQNKISYANERITDMNKEDKNKKTDQSFVIDLDAVLKRSKSKGWSKEDLIYYSLITPADYAMIEQRKNVERRVMVLLCNALGATENELTYKEKEAQYCKIDPSQMRAIGKRFDTIDEQFDLITKDIHKLSSMQDSIICALGRLESVAEVLRLSGVTKDTLDKAVEKAVLDIAVLTDRSVPIDGKVSQNEIVTPSKTDDAPIEEDKSGKESKRGGDSNHRRRDNGSHIRKGTGLPTETVKEMKVGDVIYIGYDNLSDFRSKRYSAMWTSRNTGYVIEARMSDKEKRIMSITRLS